MLEFINNFFHGLSSFSLFVPVVAAVDPPTAVAEGETSPSAHEEKGEEKMDAPEAVQAVEIATEPEAHEAPTEKALTPSAKETLPAVPDYVPTEVFLETCGFFTPSSKRIKGTYTKEKTIAYKTLPDGKKQPVKVKISANHELGLPITSDEDYWHAFEKILSEIADQDGRIRLPIAVPTKQLIRYAGKQLSKITRKEAQAWLNRMTLTGLAGGIYRAKAKEYQEGFVGTVFSQVVRKGEKMKNGETAETNYVWLAPWYLSNFYYRYQRPLDFSFYNRLRKPISKGLRSLLETGWYASAGNPYKKSYSDLCSEFLITKFNQLSRIKQQLDPAHRELQREGFLLKWEYRPSKEREGDYIVSYYAGEKFFETQQARKARVELAEKIRERPKELPDTSREEQKVRADLFIEDILAVTHDRENRGYYSLVVRKLSEQTIRLVLSETKDASLTGKIRTTPARYFTDLIKRHANEQGISL